MSTRLLERLERFLRSLERYTRTDMVYVTKNGGWLVANQVGIALIAFATSLAFARFVPKDVYGTYRFLLSLFWTLTAFSLTGIPTALIRAVAKGEEGAYRQAARLMFLGTLPMSVIAAAIALYYYIAGNTVLATGALGIAVIAPFFHVGYLYGPFLEGKRDFKRNTIFGILLNLLPAVGLLVGMLWGASAVALLLIYLGCSAVTALAFLVLVRQAHDANETKSDELAHLSWHFSGMNILSTIATQLDQLLVFHFLGPVILALYSFATALPDQIKSLFGMVSNLAFPKYVERSIGEIRTLLNYRIGTMSIALALAVALYVLLAPYFFALFYPAYMNAVLYSQLYALTLLGTSSTIPLTALQAHAAKRELYIFNIATAVVQIGSLIIGVLWWGLLGVIAARAVSRFFNLALGMGLLNYYDDRTNG